MDINQCLNTHTHTGLGFEIVNSVIRVCVCMALQFSKNIALR